MAKSSKRGRTGGSRKTAETKIEDAVVVSEDAIDSQMAEAGAEVDKIVDEIVSEDISVADPTDETAADVLNDTPPTDDVTPEVETTPVELSEPVTDPVVAAPPPVVVKKGGFFPMALGGLVAGGIGYGAAYMGLGMPAQEDTVTPQITAQAEQIAQLEATIAALPAPEALPDLPDFDAMQASVEAVGAEAASQSEALQSTLADMDQRLTAVERAPNAAGEVAETAITSIERELATVREEIAAQQTRVQEIADEAANDVAEAQALAAEQEAAAQAASAAAEQAAQNRLAEAAIAEIRTSLETGAPFDAAVTALQDLGVEVPEGLSAIAADGAITPAQLQSEFPDAARGALSSVRSSGENSGGGGLTSFFQSQLGVRSTAPREGDDPDAVLSRAEAAVRSGDLATATTEIDALPDSAKEALADWLGRSAQRQSAVDALDTLSSSVDN